MNIKKLLAPNRICVVGASEKAGFGGDTCKNIIKHMEDGSYYFVNPKRDEIFAKPCYHSVAEVPEDFDLVVICTPLQTVEGVLEQAAAKKAGGAIVFASGYSEIGTPEGKKAQADLVAQCKKYDIALMGPNCAGFVNYVSMKYPFAFLSQDRDRRGGVGLVSQSGQICLSMMESPSLKFSYAISAGNSAVVEMEDYLEYLVHDESTRVVAMYLEGVKNPQKFAESLAYAAKIRKPVIVLKAGRSEKGSKIAASHTGSLSGADKVFDAVFKKFGVIRVDDIEELVAVSQMFDIMQKIPKGKRIASMNLSGGETSVCADVGSAWKIDYPDFMPETIAKLKAMLPSYASPANPLDMTATLSYDVEGYAEVLRTVMKDENIDIVAMGYTLLEEITDPAIFYMTQSIEMVAGEPDSKPMVMIPFVEGSRNPEYYQRLAQVGVPVLPPTTYAFKCLKYLSDFAAYNPHERTLEIALRNSGANNERVSLSEHESKRLIEKYAIDIPREAVAKTAEEAVKLAQEIGYPVVMKIDSRDIMHKSDAGCVKLNITTNQQVEIVFNQIIDNAKAFDPNAAIGGVLIQQMMDKSSEIIIGVNNDPQFGPVVMCGMGGVFVEIFKDVSLYPAPLNMKEAKEMLTSLKSYRLLTGYRGSEALDVDALCRTIVQVSKLAEENKDILLELDLNPVFVYKNGVAVADALAILNGDK